MKTLKNFLSGAVSVVGQRSGSKLKGFGLGLLLALLIPCAKAQAAPGDIQLAWNASATAGVTNYVLYAHTNTLTATTASSAAVRVGVGTNLTVTVVAPSSGQWFFYVTAVKGGLESVLSNAVQTEVPAAPANMRTVTVQYGGVITNLQDAGFFRLKVQ